MKIFVINLEKDEVRLNHISSEMKRAALNFERIPGVCGRDLSHSALKRHYDDRRAKWHQARSLTASEIGCALSHIEAYQKIVNQGLPRALVLEDDVLIPSGLSRVLEALARHMPAEQPIVCLLSPASPKSNPEIELGDERHCIAPLRRGFYASSYALTRAAARTLAETLYPVADVADCWRRLDRHGVVRVFVTVPAVIEQDQATFGSSTTPEIFEAVGTGRWAVMRYKARRVRNIACDFLQAAWTMRPRRQGFSRRRSGIDVRNG